MLYQQIASHVTFLNPIQTPFFKVCGEAPALARSERQAGAGGSGGPGSGGPGSGGPRTVEVRVGELARAARPEGGSARGCQPGSHAVRVAVERMGWFLLSIY